MIRTLASTTSIASREFASLARTPVGWVVTALYFLLTSGVFVATTLIPGEPASLRYFFGPAGILLLAVAPAISMRLFSEELRTGTVEPLTASPAGDGALVVGKFFGAVLFLASMLVPTLAFPIVLAVFSHPMPDPGPIVSGYLGLMLVGSLYLAIGLLISTLTDSQTLAFLATLMILLVLVVLIEIAAPRLPVRYAQLATAGSVTLKMRGFAKGIVDTSSIVFFLSSTLAPLALATMTLSRRRWR